MRDSITKMLHQRRGITKLGFRLGQEGAITEEERAQFLDAIQQVDVKAKAVEQWVTIQGDDLVETLGNWVSVWNTNFNQATLLSPTINQIVADLSSSDPSKWTWSTTKQSTLENWTQAINKLFEIMTTVSQQQPPDEEPEPTPDQPPPTPPASDGFPWGWVAAGGAVVVVAGTAIYFATR